MQCPNCGTDNNANSRFCLRCGSALAAAPASARYPAQPYPPPNQPPAQRPAPVPYQPPQSQMYNPPSPAGYPQQPLAQRPAYSPLAAQYGQPASAGITNYSALSIWGPFAGYGTRRRHVGWLMDNCGDRANDLVQRVGAKFKERQIPDATINGQVLVARGIGVENRPYFLLQRGLATMGLYISQFGRDLYISQVSYLKPPVSTFRVLFLVLMILFWLFSSFALPALVRGSLDSFSSYGGPDYTSLLALVCVVGPLGSVNSIALFLFVVYSIYKFIKEKDFIAGLRTTPNEFNEDDLMAMEKAVEQTVRICLDEIGLNQADLKPVYSSSERRII